jgi:hypothetical protein
MSGLPCNWIVETQWEEVVILVVEGRRARSSSAEGIGAVLLYRCHGGGVSECLKDVGQLASHDIPFNYNAA